MAKIVECVPNFSEGIDLAIVSAIVSAIKTAKVVDVHSDADHNRSVATIVGKPEEAKQAAFDLTRRAMQLLDVNDRIGVHPFIGVVDVIPFVPLVDCSVEETCDLSHQLAKDLWHKLKLPVYLYGAAAIKDEHQELPYVRRGGYRALKEEIRNARRKPDIGHGLHVTAGAVAVGVRDFLIAFNVNLATQDIDIARSIARNIREKSGGLAGIRSLGVELESRGITQVTINVTNHRMTSLARVFDEVKKWAKEYQVEIIDSEIVGLVPEEAVFPGMKDYLKLPGFSQRQVLENHL